MIAIFRGERTLVTLSPLQPPARLSADLSTSGARYVLAPEALWSERAPRYERSWDVVLAALSQAAA